jgi:hypothetical protein
VGRMSIGDTTRISSISSRSRAMLRGVGVALRTSARASVVGVALAVASVGAGPNKGVAHRSHTSTKP